MGYKWYRFTFNDGFTVSCRGLDKVELSHLVHAHGKLINKTLVGVYK